MNYKARKSLISRVRSYNDANHNVPTRSNVSAEVVRKRIEHQMRRELREYEKMWEI